MGDRHHDGKGSGRRHARSAAVGHGHPAAGARGAGTSDGDAAALEALLGAALRESVISDERERRAMDAFRAARAAGAQGNRSRRRDDWRPREQWRVKRSVKTMAALFLASLTLGGAAFAAIGSVRSPSDGDEDGRGRARSSASPDRPSGQEQGTASSASSGPASPGHPSTAQDTLAHCRAYEAVRGRGKAMDSSAWERLISAAGGERNVEAYCARELEQADGHATPKPGRSAPAARESRAANGNKPEHPGEAATRPAGKPDR